MAVLHWGGVPDGRRYRTGGVPILLGEGVCAARGRLLPRTPSFLRSGGNSSQAQFNRADRDFHSPVQGCRITIPASPPRGTQR